MKNDNLCDVMNIIMFLIRYKEVYMMCIFEEIYAVK